MLVAACKEKNIAYDATYSAIYNSSYVKGIGYLYEKMAGDMSGWLYLVDGKTPNVGASAYRINGGRTDRMDVYMQWKGRKLTEAVFK